jgi:hypothetical protein
MKIKDKLMIFITLGILGFIGLVVIGEYSSMLLQQSASGEKYGTNEDAIALVQNALVGLIGIIGGYLAGRENTKED